jgi:hypothetical protein
MGTLSGAFPPPSRMERLIPLRRPGLILSTVLALALLTAPAIAQPVPMTATAAKTHCQYYSKGGPCAPIMSVYTYSGYHEGDLKLIWAKLEPQHKVGTTYVSAEPVPGTRQVFKRIVAWASLPDVEITAAYVVHVVGKGFSYRKLPTGKHSGQVTLIEIEGDGGPILLLQGRRIG